MTVHVAGAGLAGLTAALAAADGGAEVVLHEASPQAGGRARSWHDYRLGAVIDNGTHLVIGGNRAIFSLLQRIGAGASLRRLDPVLTFRPLDGGAPWRASPWRLLPELAAGAWRLGRNDTIGQALSASRYYERFWHPLALAILNTPPEAGSAALLRRVLRESLALGPRSFRPSMAAASLDDSFAGPALAALARLGVEFRTGQRLKAIAMSDGRVRELGFARQSVLFGRKDSLILAVPNHEAVKLLPDLSLLPTSPIVNVHFRLDDSKTKQSPPVMTGILGGAAQWLFYRNNILSVTVSAAFSLIDRSVEEIAELLWADSIKALTLQENMPPWTVVKERRATLFHDDATEIKRPQAVYGENLFLAGDWTATGLPSTLEGAVRSGRKAAQLALLNRR